MDHQSTKSAFSGASKSAASKAVLLVAHGERGGRLDNALLLKLAKDVSERLDKIEIAASVLKGSPSLAEGWSNFSASERYVYPFFMSDGFFVSRILPKKIHEAIGSEADNLTMLPPFGVSPDLGPALLQSLTQTLEGLDRASETPPLLIAAHGASIDKQSSLRANQLAHFLAQSGRFSKVDCAFLDEAPYLESVVPDLDPQSLVLPLFNGLGSHSIDDMAELKAMSPAGCHYLPPVGGESWVADIVAHDIEQALFGAGSQCAHKNAAQ